MFGPIGLIDVLADLLYFVYENPVLSHYFMVLWLSIYFFLTLQEFVSWSVSMTSIQIFSVVQVNCLLDFFCFLFILYTTKELHVLNNYHVLTIKFFLIKVEIVLVLH